MRLFGLQITRQKASPPLATVDTGRGWWPVIRESFTGAWQRNEEIRVDTSLSNPVLFRCVTLIANDIAKMRLRLVAQDSAGIWSETESPAFSALLRKPNRYQTRIQFIFSWVLSKVVYGNVYVLKVRDNRNVVSQLYVLDPNRVKVLVAPDGSVFYQVKRDDLSGVSADLPAIPASEIIHDRWNTLFHPLVGLSPIYAAGLPALQAQEISNTATRFFRNGARPSGLLTSDNEIDDVMAARLSKRWQENHGGLNLGKVAVMGSGLKFAAMAMNYVDAQVIEQLKWTGETIAGTLGVPAYMAGVGAAPLNNNVEALAQQYYSQCLQILIESIEECLDEGLGLLDKKDGVRLGTEFDLDDLLRMDSASQVKALVEGLKGLYAPNEARRKMNLGPVTGGEQVYLQQQNYSVEALAKRDAKDDPFDTSSGSAKSIEPPPTAANDDVPPEDLAAEFGICLTREAENLQIARLA